MDSTEARMKKNFLRSFTDVEHLSNSDNIASMKFEKFGPKQYSLAHMIYFLNLVSSKIGIESMKVFLGTFCSPDMEDIHNTSALLYSVISVIAAY